VVTRSEEAPTAGFGEHLRREREMRGVSLEEISASTRISIRFLQAIENEELSKLPGGIFTRSFVRTYARYLGLDEERVLADCQLAGKQKPEVDIRRITTSQTRPNGAAARTRIIGLVVAIALLAGGYALFRHSRRVREQRNSTPVAISPSTPAPVANLPLNAAAGQPTVPAAQESNPTETATPPSPGGATTAPGTPQSGPPAPGAKANPTEQIPTSEATSSAAGLSDLVLQVAATERAWVAVDADGKTVLQKVMNPNEVENLKAHDSFDVTVGNAQGIVLTLNGETLKPLGRSGEVKSIHLTREDLKNSALER
jgi:cytoskeletal protein RodZ